MTAHLRAAAHEEEEEGGGRVSVWWYMWGACWGIPHAAGGVMVLVFAEGFVVTSWLFSRNTSLHSFCSTDTSSMDYFTVNPSHFNIINHREHRNKRKSINQINFLPVSSFLLISFCIYSFQKSCKAQSPRARAYRPPRSRRRVIASVSDSITGVCNEDAKANLTARVSVSALIWPSPLLKRKPLIPTHLPYCQLSIILTSPSLWKAQGLAVKC